MPVANTTKNTQGRAWCFTMYRTDEPAFRKDCMTYMIYQREKCPDTERLHWQGYVYFKNPKTMGGVKKALNDQTVHLEKARGSPEQNKTYCSKEESRVKETQPKEHGVIPAQGQRNDLIEVADALMKGMEEKEIARQWPEVVIKHWNGIKNWKHIMLSKGPRQGKKTFVIFISGPAGCGKSMAVNALYPDAYPKDGRTKFWDWYFAQDVVNIDDFYGVDPKGEGLALGKMLNIMDRYPCLVEPKGKTAVHFNSDLMFITSNKTPEEIYPQLKYDWVPSFRRRIDIEYKYVGDDYDVTAFTQKGWYRRHFNGSGKPTSWEPAVGDLDMDLRFMMSLRKWLPKPWELKDAAPESNVIDISDDETVDIADSEDEAIVPASPLPNAAELLAAEALVEEDEAEMAYIVEEFEDEEFQREHGMCEGDYAALLAAHPEYDVQARL